MTSQSELVSDKKINYPGDVIGSDFETVSQSNSRFNVLDTLIVNVHSIKTPVRIGGMKTMGRPVPVMAHLKKLE